MRITEEVAKSWLGSLRWACLKMPASAREGVSAKVCELMAGVGIFNDEAIDIAIKSIDKVLSKDAIKPLDVANILKWLGLKAPEIIFTANIYLPSNYKRIGDTDETISSLYMMTVTGWSKPHPLSHVSKS